MNKKKSISPKQAKSSPSSLSADKQQRLRDNLRKTLLQFIEGKRYEPLGKIALLKRLGIPQALHTTCRDILDELLAEGTLELLKNRVHLKTVEIQGIRGILRTHPRGFGFVIPDRVEDSPQDIFIPKHAMGDAVDGDHVEVEVAPSSWESEKGPEGRIHHIVKRGRSHIAGIVQNIGSSNTVHIYVPLLGANRPFIAPNHPAHPSKVGDRVILHVTNWGKNNSQSSGEICHFLGHISDPSIDVKAAAEEFGLPQEFSPDIVHEVLAIGTKVKPSDWTGREDLRDLVCFTIDPTTARDFDDAISLSRDKKGHYHLGVHIADVAHYVKAGSLLDREASERCNSTYFPGQCIPMLPEELSNHLCSLKPQVLRLTVSVVMVFDAEGTLLDSRITRSVIKSKKRYTYEEAKAILDGKKKSPHAEDMALMVELCLLLKKKRRERGSIDFALSESVLEVDDKGMPLGMKIVEYDISHQLVEEFMLKANETVATYFAKRKAPLLFRVHEEPPGENLQDFYQLARNLGFFLPPDPTQKDLQELFEKARVSSSAQQLAVGFIRSMKLATYSPENAGHYGLALEYYCHFTSPIRRYSDLITQRLLFDEQSEEIDLDAIAKKCSEQERISFKAEMSVKVLKKLRLLHRYFEKDPTHVYSATINRIKPFGISFEIASLMLEGFLHISQLGNDYFLFDEQRGLLVGKHTGFTFTVGKIIDVRLLAVDFVLQESRWEMATESSKQKKSFPATTHSDKKSKNRSKETPRSSSKPIHPRKRRGKKR